MILQLIGWACIAHILTDFISELNLPLPNKPFKCNLCLGYWISVIPLTVQYGLKGILFAAISGVLSELILRVINRL